MQDNKSNKSDGSLDSDDSLIQTQRKLRKEHEERQSVSKSSLQNKFNRNGDDLMLDELPVGESIKTAGDANNFEKAINDY